MKFTSTGVLILILALSAHFATAQSDTTFFDADWHKTARGQASYYRPQPIQAPGGLYEVHDHFINNNIQMNSFIPDLASDKLEGKTSFYDVTGHKEGEGMYKDGKKTGSWRFYFFGSDRLKSVQPFRNDSVIGRSVFYDSTTGEKFSEGEFSDAQKRTGEWRFYFRNQIIRKEYYGDSISTFINFDSTTFLIRNAGGYKNNKEDGPWTAYNTSTGKLFGIRHYKNGLLDGAYKMYDTTTGRIFVDGHFSSGEKCGTWTTYWLNGSIKIRDSILSNKSHLIMHYDSVTGKPAFLAKGDPESGNTHFTIFFPGTNIIAEEKYMVNAKNNGQAIYYDLESKKKRSEGIYKDNKYIGIWTFYFRRTGRLKSTETYDNGVLQGEAIYYDSLTGKKIADAWFTDGKRDSIWKRYFAATGSLKVKERYKNGKYDGERIVYHTSGKILSQENYTNGVKDGKWTEYYPTTNVPEVKINFKNGVKDGEQTDYYIDGKIKRKEIYSDSRMTEGKMYLQDGKETIYFPHSASSSFPGDLDTYTETYLHYPHPALVAHREGIVRATFKVNADGTLSDIKIINGIGGMCDEAVVNFLSDMPKWNPAMLEGKAQQSISSILVRFRAATGTVHVTPAPDNEE